MKSPAYLGINLWRGIVAGRMLIALSLASSSILFGMQNPTTAGSASPATVAAVGGDNQTGTPGEFNAKPFDIAVWNAAGTQPLTDTEVTFTVQSGGGLLGANTDPGNLPSVTLTLRTDQDGTVQAYYQQPPLPGILSQIKASAAGGEIVLQTRTLTLDELNKLDPTGKHGGTDSKSGGANGGGSGIVIAFLNSGGGKAAGVKTPIFSRRAAALALPSQILLRTVKGDFAVNPSNWSIAPYTAQ